MQIMTKPNPVKALFLGIVAAALMGTVAYAADPPAEDPVAMAQVYEKQAAEYRAQAEKHDRMAKSHKAGAGSSKVNHKSIARHCENIAKSLRAAANESDALAAALRSGK